MKRCLLVSATVLAFASGCARPRPVSHMAGAQHGAALGAVGGWLGGAIAGYALSENETGFCIVPCTRFEKALGVGLVGGGAGGLLGLIVGGVVGIEKAQTLQGPAGTVAGTTMRF